MHSLYFTRESIKALARMPRETSMLIRQKLQHLAQSPHAPNPNAAKLQGRDGYRLRVADWRVIYEIDDGKLRILVIAVAHRKEVYR